MHCRICRGEIEREAFGEGNEIPVCAVCIGIQPDAPFAAVFAHLIGNIRRAARGKFPACERVTRLAAKYRKGLSSLGFHRHGYRGCPFERDLVSDRRICRLNGNGDAAVRIGRIARVFRREVGHGAEIVQRDRELILAFNNLPDKGVVRNFAADRREIERAVIPAADGDTIRIHAVQAPLEYDAVLGRFPLGVQRNIVCGHGSPFRRSGEVGVKIPPLEGIAAARGNGKRRVLRTPQEFCSECNFNPIKVHALAAQRDRIFIGFPMRVEGCIFVDLRCELKFFAFRRAPFDKRIPRADRIGQFFFFDNRTRRNRRFIIYRVAGQIESDGKVSRGRGELARNRIIACGHEREKDVAVRIVRPRSAQAIAAELDRIERGKIGFVRNGDRYRVAVRSRCNGNGAFFKPKFFRNRCCVHPAAVDRDIQRERVGFHFPLRIQHKVFGGHRVGIADGFHKTAVVIPPCKGVAVALGGFAFKLRGQIGAIRDFRNVADRRAAVRYKGDRIFPLRPIRLNGRTLRILPFRRYFSQDHVIGGAPAQEDKPVLLRRVERNRRIGNRAVLHFHGEVHGGISCRVNGQFVLIVEFNAVDRFFGNGERTAVRGEPDCVLFRSPFGSEQNIARVAYLSQQFDQPCDVFNRRIAEARSVRVVDGPRIRVSCALRNRKSRIPIRIARMVSYGINVAELILADGRNALETAAVCDEADRVSRPRQLRMQLDR